MFEGGGVPAEQFHQFIESSRTSLPLHAHAHGHSSFPPVFDPPYPPLLHSLHHHPLSHQDDHHQPNTLMSINLEIPGDASLPIDDPTSCWSADEVLALLRIRSSLDNWLPDSTWEHVSRKLAELGFKRSAEKCKLKFEEESSRYFNDVKNYDDLEHQLYNSNPHPHVEDDSTKVIETNPSEDTATQVIIEKCKGKNKRKRKQQFEMLKRFCENIVSKLLAQQEEMHNKLLEDMVKRDADKVAREEAWKKQEMDNIDKQLEKRAHEQALAGDRQVMIIECLNKFNSASSSSSSSSQHQMQLLKLPSTTTTAAAATARNEEKKPTPVSSNMKTAPKKKPNSMNGPTNINNKEEVGKRWPKDEVVALINLRSSLYSSGEDKEGGGGGGGGKGPLWERMSQGMLELGYKRSAKRCKEKWENINKYFRKTKDANKKRSVESRTCPYFHQLSSLYNQTTPSASAMDFEL